jgi:hypothetical protein
MSTCRLLLDNYGFDLIKSATPLYLEKHDDRIGYNHILKRHDDRTTITLEEAEIQLYEDLAYSQRRVIDPYVDLCYEPNQFGYDFLVAIDFYFESLGIHPDYNEDIRGNDWANPMHVINDIYIAHKDRYKSLDVMGAYHSMMDFAINNGKISNKDSTKITVKNPYPEPKEDFTVIDRDTEHDTEYKWLNFELNRVFETYIPSCTIFIARELHHFLECNCIEHNKDRIELQQLEYLKNAKIYQHNPEFDYMYPIQTNPF